MPSEPMKRPRAPSHRRPSHPARASATTGSSSRIPCTRAVGLADHQREGRCPGCSRARQTTAIEPSSVPSTSNGCASRPVDDRAPLRLVGRRDRAWRSPAGWGSGPGGRRRRSARPRRRRRPGRRRPSRRPRRGAVAHAPRRDTSSYGGVTTRSRTSPARSGRSAECQTWSSSLDGSQQHGEGGAAARQAGLDGALGDAEGAARPRRRAGRRGGAARWPRAERRAAGAARPSGRGGPRAGRRTPRSGPARGAGGLQRSIRRHRLRATLTATVRSQASGLSASGRAARRAAARANASITTSSASAGSPVTPTSCPTRRGYDAAYTSRSRPSSAMTPPCVLLCDGSLEDATSGRRTEVALRMP